VLRVKLKQFHFMATIYDIAKAANTSPASVSRVINGRGGVRDDASVRIKEVMDALNFQPRWKALDRNRFLVFVPEYRGALHSGYVARIMSGIFDASFPAGFGLQLRPFSSQGRAVGELRQLYMQEAVSGCILISMYQGYSLPSRLDLAGLPHVVVGHKWEDDDINQVILDDFEAGKIAAEFLISLGHQRIDMVSFSHMDRGHLDRYAGFAEAMRAVGRKTPTCIECSEASYGAGKAAARRVLSPNERPTAVVVTNEDIAVGFQAEAREMGFSIPDDLSLVGFEETDKLSLLDTPMTAMQTPAYAMGVEAVKLLRSTIPGSQGSKSKSSSNFATKHISIPLVARQSTVAVK
jgi:DNA-binding LacI/PurR family transcriptional regulator